MANIGTPVSDILKDRKDSKVCGNVNISDLASSVTGRLESVPDGHNVES